MSEKECAGCFAVNKLSAGKCEKCGGYSFIHDRDDRDFMDDHDSDEDFRNPGGTDEQEENDE